MAEKVSRNKIHAAEEPLANIFSSQFEFSIPDYQRPYSWGEEQAAQLLSDITEAADRSGDEPYFLGSLVLVKEEDRPSADVIDGQQRLTTLTILIAVLRELSIDDDVKKELQQCIVEPGRKINGIRSNPRLHLRHRDRDFFEQYIQASGRLEDLVALGPNALKTDAQKAIQRNASHFVNELRALTEDELMSLIMMINTRTFLVVVSTADLDSAHRIFSVMNARGLDLSAADIFKAELVGAVEESARKKYADRWEQAEVDLGRDQFADLFQHIRMVMTKVRARQEILKEFRDDVIAPYLSSRSAESFIDDVILPYASAYAVVIDKSYQSDGHATAINRWLTRLEQLDNSDWVPPVLWAFKHHSDDDEWLVAFLTRLERLAASMLIRREYATPRSQRYAALLKDLDAGLGLDSPSLGLDPLERGQTILALQQPIYKASRVVKYVLLRLDETLAGQSGVTYEHPIISVEHVLPQTPGLGSEWTTVFSDEERQVWTHRLGNLVLLNRRKNASASNRDFDYKKASYFSGRSGSAPFTLTIQVLQEERWTPEVLEERQNRHLASLVALWSLS